MAPPKRALFSLNLDSDAERVYQRVDDHSKQGTDKVQVFESSGPSVGHTKFEFATKPFERLVNRTVEGVIQGSGKKVHSAEGDLVYETQREEKSTGNNKTVTVRKSTSTTTPTK